MRFLYIPRNKPLYDRFTKYWNNQSFRHNYKNYSATFFLGIINVLRHKMPLTLVRMPRMASRLLRSIT